MSRRHRRGKAFFLKPGANGRTGTGLSDPAGYWPLTIVPSTSKPRRLVLNWLIIGAVVLFAGGLTFARQRGNSGLVIPASR
jgi:hypothetical protein